MYERVMTTKVARKPLVLFCLISIVILTKQTESISAYFSLCCAVFVDGSAMSMGCSSGLINNLRLKCGISQSDTKRGKGKCRATSEIEKSNFINVGL